MTIRNPQFSWPHHAMLVIEQAEWNFLCVRKRQGNLKNTRLHRATNDHDAHQPGTDHAHQSLFVRRYADLKVSRKFKKSNSSSIHFTREFACVPRVCVWFAPSLSQCPTHTSPGWGIFLKQCLILIAGLSQYSFSFSEFKFRKCQFYQRATSFAKLNFLEYIYSSVDLGVTCSPRDPRFTASNPAEVDGFFRT